VNIREIRQQYPQYKDLSDVQLADALHDKFYSDMPKQEFYTKIGMDSKGPAPRPEATMADRGQALIAGVNRGVAGLAGLPVDTFHGAVNLAAMAGHAALSPVMDTGVFTPPLHGGIGSSEDIANRMRGVGLWTENPNPEDAASRMAYTGGMIGATAGRRPIAPAAAGAVAGEVLGPQWAAPASMAPAAAGQAVAAARASVANRVQPNVQQFREAGTQPTVGQATESNFIQGLENVLSKFPGGQGIFRRFAEKQQEQLGSSRTGTSAEDAGRAIEEGTKGFIGRTKQVWTQLDQAVAAKVPQGSRYEATNTVKALDDLTSPVPGAEKTTGTLVNPKLAQLRENLAADLQANNGQLPFEAIRSLRTRIGSMLDDSLVSGVPNGELKRVYRALSNDLEAAANKAGAGKEFARQNDYYKARMDRIENVLERVVGKTPEETFQRFLPKDENQATTVRAVMRSLDPEQRQVVQQAVVDRLGRAKSGKQDETGELFSSETFLTNWNKMSDGAKAQIFSDPAVRKNMDAIAGASANIREGSKVFANPSGSAEKGAALSLAGAAGASVFTGNPTPITVAAGLVASANVGARMLTNPKVVEWLAQAPRIQPDNTAAHLARLGVLFNETKDERLKEELGAFIQSVDDFPPKRGAPANRTGGGSR
jgi:hypothetical protein